MDNGNDSIEGGTTVENNRDLVNDTLPADYVKRIADLQNLTAIQRSPGNGDADDYMRGMANGMILAEATMKGEEPVYMEGPVQSRAGLPVAGYKATQPQAAIDAVNTFKEFEERTLRHIDTLMGTGTIRDQIRKSFDAADGSTGSTGVNVDGRWMAIGRTQLQQAFMSLCRGVFQPGRVRLPEDEPPRDIMQHAGEDTVG